MVHLFKKALFLTTTSRHCTTLTAQYCSSKSVPKTPELIYVPHILRWLKTKLKFKYLQKKWDPDFSEGAFIYGTSTAICRITEIISNNNVEELDGLLTTNAKEKLIEDAKRLTQFQRTIIRIRPDDIKILVPLSVNLIADGLERKCSVDLRILALKWYEITGSLRLVLVALQSEFFREYSNRSPPEWTISRFDILECVMLSEASKQ